MRDYVIRTYRREESEKVLNVLRRHNVENIKVESAIMAYESIRFSCKKDVWKTIRKELNLEITTVFSKIKIEP